METLEKLNITKKELERKIEEVQQKYKEEVWEKEKQETLKKRHVEENLRLRGFYEIAIQTYKMLEDYLGKETNPKLLWLLTSLIENRSESYASYGGGTLGGQPILNKKRINEFIDTLEKALALMEQEK